MQSNEEDHYKNQRFGILGVLNEFFQYPDSF